jgi:hypothetical protein
MDKIFKELLAVNGVRGALVIASNGKVRYPKSGHLGSLLPGSVDWPAMLGFLAGIHEAEFLCEHLRIYIRKAEDDWLLVLMGPKASPAMVRLNCDILLPLLKERSGAKGLRRLFKR